MAGDPAGAPAVTGPDLPVRAVLPQLLAALQKGTGAVLVAPPGAGKTSSVAPALLCEPWCSGQVIMTSPRRIAARAAAERMAEIAGEAPGETFGYATRIEARSSARTRVLVVTEGILVNRLIADPELRGISALLFDEVHERSLDGDFALALALEARAAFRNDLRIVPMSATLDGARFASLLGDAPVIESAGRSHPLEIVHVGRDAGQPLEQAMARAILAALAQREGDCLAFLPGVREIERTRTALGERPGLAVLPLHGSLEPQAQRRALAPDADGRRKLILATSIAETSLTIDGVRIVVDSGLARRPRFDQAAGIGRLVTERASHAAATQRAGRAARQGPGTAFRLWEAAAEGGMPRYDTPAILESDLAGLVLACAIWGERDPCRLAWLDPPPAAAVAEARRRLEALGALDGDGRATRHGEALATLPVEPGIGHMLLVAATRGQAGEAARIAALLQERGLGGSDTDIERRLERWRAERGQRAAAAQRWAERLARLAERGADRTGQGDALSTGQLLALAFPERVARRRSADGTDWIAAGGRGFRLDPADPLSRAGWLAIADAQGSAGGARILSAAMLDEAEVETLFADRIGQVRRIAWNGHEGRVEARLERRLGAIRLASGPLPDPDPMAVAAALCEAVRREGLDLLPFAPATRALRTRASFAGIDCLADAALLADTDAWLLPLAQGVSRPDAIDPAALHAALEGLVGWDERQRLDSLAPAAFADPLGHRHPIDYAAPAGPSVALRVQALFGLATHPVVGSAGIPLVLELLSPAGRPIQTTRDLPGFWAGSWREVAREMRGRYPRHRWPDNPAGERPSLKTRAALAREQDAGG